MNWVSRKKQNPPIVQEPLAESSLYPVVCPRCGRTFEGDVDSIPARCTQCGTELDLETQFTFIRGVDAFDYGQRLLMEISPRTRRRNPFSAVEMDAVRYYQQAYNSLQLASQGALAESQRRLMIEMLSSIVFIQFQHQVISSIEASYWQSLLKELTMQLEVIEVEEKIANLSASPIQWLLRIRWKIRLHQLKAALIDIDRRIEKMEASIEFVVPPNVRRKTLPPLEGEQE